MRSLQRPIAIVMATDVYHPHRPEPREQTSSLKHKSHLAAKDSPDTRLCVNSRESTSSDGCRRTCLLLRKEMTTRMRVLSRLDVAKVIGAEVQTRCLLVTAGEVW